MRKTYLKLLAGIIGILMLSQSVPLGIWAQNAKVQWIFNSASAVEELKTTKVLKEYIRGDIDESMGISATDINLLKRQVSGNLDFDTAPNIFITGDLNGDMAINAADINLLKRVLTGTLASQKHYDLENITAIYDKELDSALLTVDRDVTDGIKSSLNVSLNGAKYAVITYLIPTGENGNSAAGVSASIGTATEAVFFDYTADGCFHSAVVDLSDLESTGTANTLVFNYFQKAKVGDRLFIDSIALCETIEGANAVVAERIKAKEGFYNNEQGVGGVPLLSSVDKFGSKVIRFNSEKKVSEYVSLYKNTDFSYDEEENALKCTTTAVSDPGVYIDLSKEDIYAGEFNRFVVIYKVPSNMKRRTPKHKIYFMCDGATTADANCALPEANIIKEDKYNYIRYTVGAGVSGLTGKVTGIRLDYYESAAVGDTCYIDSIIFAKGSTEREPLTYSYQRILREKNGEGALHVSAPWIEYWNMYPNANDYEYVCGSGENIEMNFRYSSLDTLTSTSLGNRMARAVREATGYDVACSIYGGVEALRSVWDSDIPSAKIYYNFTFEGTTYIVYIKTNIIKDASFVDSLDGDPTQADPSYNVTDNWSVDGITVSDASALPVSTSSIAAHSNHETRLVETPDGTFAVIPMNDNGAAWGTIGISCNIYKIEDDGSYRSIYTFQCANHSSKPNIFYAADGLVYVLVGDAVGNDYVSAFVAYFDPAKPNADGTYNVISSRTELKIGAVGGGWGYTQPILNDTLGMFTLMCCGGSGSGYFGWANYNYKTHQWIPGVYVKELETYRHCYLYGFSDGADGMYVVGGRDVLLSTLGLSGTVYGADYAWDEVNLFHFPSVAETSYKRYTVSAADYNQMYANIFPGTANNFRGDTYISDDGYLHVITSTFMHGNNHHDIKYWEMWYTVYDVSQPGAAPKEVYHKPISFADSKNEYAARMVKDKEGNLYIVAMKGGSNVCEIWRQKEGSYEFEMVANKIFEGSNGVTTAMIVTNSRNGSVNDNTISIIYPTNDGGGTKYQFFTVDLGK